MRLPRLIQLPAPDGRLWGIELARFTAAFAVLLAHYGHFFSFGLVQEDFSIFRQPLFGLFESFYMYGTRAVEVFWCISGFIFLHQYGEAIHAHRVTPMKFFWLRFSRLYPLHLATLLLVAVLQLVYRHQHDSFYVVAWNDLRHFLLNLPMASHWGLQMGDSFNAAIWSVSLEVLVYVFFFATTWFVRIGFVEVLVCLGGCVVANHLLGREAVFSRCLFYFYLGGLTALACLHIRRELARVGGWFVLAAAVMFVVAVLRFRATQDLDFWLLGVATPSALLALALASGWFSPQAARLAEGLGNLTYASYLIHFPLQLVVMLGVGVLGVRHDFAYSPVFCVIYLAVVLVLSRLTFLYFELPARDWLRKRRATG